MNNPTEIPRSTGVNIPPHFEAATKIMKAASMRAAVMWSLKNGSLSITLLIEACRIGVNRIAEPPVRTSLDVMNFLKSPNCSLGICTMLLIQILF